MDFCLYCICNLESGIIVGAGQGYSAGKALVELEKEKYKDRIDPYIPDTISENKEREEVGV